MNDQPVHVTITSPQAPVIPPPDTPPTTTPSSPLPAFIESILHFFKHPGTTTASGLALAALSAFTSAVPANQRTDTTLAGLAFSVSTVLIDYLKSR